MSVQITNAANPSAGFSLAEDYCRKNQRSVGFVAQNGATADIERYMKVAGVILAQILPFADQKALQLLADFGSAVYKNGRAV
ncbi:MAG: hypothetical protein ACXWKQ_05705 [Reyranella sp.]